MLFSFSLMEAGKLLGLFLVFVLLVGVPANFVVAGDDNSDNDKFDDGFVDKAHVARAKSVSPVSIGAIGAMTIKRADGSAVEVEIEEEIENGASKKKIKISSVDATVEVEVEDELEIEEEDGMLKVRVRDRVREIKIMPDTAALAALEALKKNACVPGVCEIVLKDTGYKDSDSGEADDSDAGPVPEDDGDGEVVYEVKLDEARVRYLGIFPSKRTITAQVNAQTGEVKTNVPWFVYIVPEDSSEEVE